MDNNSFLVSPVSVLSTGDDDNNNTSPYIDRRNATTTHALNQQPSRPYPPVVRVGFVDPHDQPYFEYGHKDKPAIAQDIDLRLEGPPIGSPFRPPNPPRFHTQSFAITCWTNVSKEVILDKIVQEFGQALLQYACVAAEVAGTPPRQHLHIQIILKRKINKKSWFLDKHTLVHCNYQVTKHNCAWNEYIKKDKNFVEFGHFISPNGGRKDRWPEPPPNPQNNNNSNRTKSPSSVPAPKRLTVRGEATERRRQENEIADEALAMAETDVDAAMEFMRHKLHYKFLDRSDQWLKSFNYVHKKAQKKKQHHFEQEYVWDLSFPDCTPQLHAAVNEWIRDHFRNPHRPKCFVLIGPTGTGKTSFALSLPGPVCYFKGRWNLDTWRDNARYLVFDDVAWDEFETHNFPKKKDLLSGNGRVGVTDKYRQSTTIDIRVPAIVLLNPGDEGSLTRTPVTTKEQEEAAYWAERAVIYRMDQNEYFYKRADPSIPITAAAANLHGQRPLLGHDKEFEDAINRWLQRHRQATTATVQPPSSTITDEANEHNS